MMVGFMEPVGTSFQSAMAERMANMTTSMMRSGLASSRRNLTHFCFLALFCMSVGEVCACACSIWKSRLLPLFNLVQFSRDPGREHGGRGLGDGGADFIGPAGDDKGPTPHQGAITDLRHFGGVHHQEVSGTLQAGAGMKLRLRHAGTKRRDGDAAVLQFHRERAGKRMDERLAGIIHRQKRARSEER